MRYNRTGHIIIIIILLKLLLLLLLLYYYITKEEEVYTTIHTYYALNIYKLLLTPHAKISSSGCHATCKMFDEKSLKFW